MVEDVPARRRKRRRASAPQGAARSTPPPAVAVEAVVAPPQPRPERARRTPREAVPDRALRDLVGGGHSQLGVSGALRGRDVNRPSAEDLAEAEAELVVVRRNWHPPTG